MEGRIKEKEREGKGGKKGGEEERRGVRWVTI